ncbi:hypothetical protein CPB85DRAFT_1429278 [Mucidula mucida]|nr:hypothetical protein CPB85DRAFT_1429278 [Mucidula mucida]
MLLRRAPRFVSRQYVFRHVRLLSATPPPRLPPKADQNLSIPEQFKADIEDAQARGILRAPPAHYNGVTRFFMTTAYLLGFYVRGAYTVFARQRLTLSRTKRDDVRALYTQRQDIKKVLPFLFLALFLEEAIPFIVVYAPGFLPSTCILPGQQARIRMKQIEKARTAQLVLAQVVQDIHERPDIVAHDRKGITADPMDYKIAHEVFLYHRRELRQTMGLWVYGPLYLRGRSKYVRDDDYLFIDGAAEVHALTEDELDQALIDRGLIIPFDQTSMQAKQGILNWWLKQILDAGSHNLAFRVALVARFASLSKDLLE